MVLISSATFTFYVYYFETPQARQVIILISVISYLVFMNVGHGEVEVFGRCRNTNFLQREREPDSGRKNRGRGD